MALSEPQYLIFLAAILGIFHALPFGKPRAVFLLLASYVFYFLLSSYYAVILIGVTAVAYAAGIVVAGARCRAVPFFAATCALITAPLLIFKYSAFFAQVIQTVFLERFDGVPLSLALPVGISFFTFAALGYVIDVYTGSIPPEHRPLEFAIFLAIFPFVSAGPIVRADRFLQQPIFNRPFDSDEGIRAFQMILIGLFLKVVCADNLVAPVNMMYSAPADFIPIDKAFVLIHYMYYVYADFAGYSLIAIGSALLFGLTVPSNFRQPFLSTTVPEFWRNWHISLSSWVRDYLFTPMRMSTRRSPNAGLIASLMASFFILGLWHGAGWGFAVFGIMHGLLTVGSIYTIHGRDRAWASLRAPEPVIRTSRIILTFAIIALTMVVYRADSLADAALVYSDVLSTNLLWNVWYGLKIMLFSPGEATAIKAVSPLSFTWVLILLVVVGDIVVRRGWTVDRLKMVPRFVVNQLIIFVVFYCWIENNAVQPFLYYRF